MAGHASAVARSAVLFGAMGVTAAAIVSESIQAGYFAHDGLARALLTVLVPSGMAAAGAVIGALAGRASGPWWALTSALVMLAMGALVGGFLGIACGPLGGWCMGGRDGIACGAAVLFASTPVLALSHRLGRARAGSIAASSGEAGTWCAAGVSLAAGAALAVAAGARFAPGIRAESSTTLHLLAIAGATGSLMGACVSARVRRRGQRLCASPLEPSRAPIPESPCVDLGIGKGLWTAPCHEGPYRRGGWHQAVFTGDPRATLRSVNRDAIDSWLCALGAVVVMALGFALPAPAAEAVGVPAPAVEAHRPTPGWSGAGYPVPAGTSTAPTRVAFVEVPRRPSVLTSRDEAVVRRVIQPAVKRCVEAGLGATPKLNGPLFVLLRIARGGDIESAIKVDRWGLSPRLEICILGSIRRARFAPRGAGEETLQVPFVLPESIPL